MTDGDGDVVGKKVGRIGHVLLNRPRTLNALTLEMIRSLDQLLQDWAADDSVEAVVVTGAGDRAFCAGGDVKSVYFAGESGRADRDGTFTADFFRDEYTLNHRIANYPKPYVAYLDGITMGGGVGISVMGSHRIASEYTTFAMPETGIGFFPDVGGSYFMSQAGPIGLLLSLTGMALDYSATLELGFATHFVPRAAGIDMVERMADEGVESTLEALRRPSPKSEPLALLKVFADLCFSNETIEQTLLSLEQVSAGSDADLAELAEGTLDKLLTRSPTSLKVTFEQLRRGQRMSFTDCLIMEYRLSQVFLLGHDFREGVRAQLVDKDYSPKWMPDTIEQVDTELVEKHFRSLGALELRL
jgi:enoyl-CoA hydratase